MRKMIGRISVFIILTCAIIGSAVVFGLLAAVEVFAPARFATAGNESPIVSARAAMVVDIETGEVLYAKNEREQLPIASITKLPFAASLLASSSTDLWQTTMIVYQDVVTEGRAGSLGLAEVYSLHTLLFPLLLESSNDAAAALTRTVDGAIANANTYLESIGLTDTVLADASGLSAANVSTAEDLAHLLETLHNEDSVALDITRSQYYLYEERGWRNNNPFIEATGFEGGKHGYTGEAGHTAALIFTERFDAGERAVGYVVLGSNDLVGDVETLRLFVEENVSYR